MILFDSVFFLFSLLMTPINRAAHICSLTMQEESKFAALFQRLKADDLKVVDIYTEKGVRLSSFWSGEDECKTRAAVSKYRISTPISIILNLKIRLCFSASLGETYVNSKSTN